MYHLPVFVYDSDVHSDRASIHATPRIYLLPQVGTSRMPLILPSGGSMTGARPAALAVLSFSARLPPWGGREGGNPRLTPAWSIPVESKISHLLWQKVTKKTLIGPVRGMCQLLLLEGGGVVMGLFHLMYSQPRWRGKEIPGKKEQVTPVVQAPSVYATGRSVWLPVSFAKSTGLEFSAHHPLWWHKLYEQEHYYGIFDPYSIINAPWLAQVSKMQQVKYTWCYNFYIPLSPMAISN